MADGITYGINFPFRDSKRGDYLELTQTESAQIKSDLIHLLLTRKGSRYYLPDFGTRLYEYIFEPFDGLTFSAIESDIRDSIEKYMPNLLLNNITITPADPQEEVDIATGQNFVGTSESSIYRLPGKGTSEYTAKVRIDYSNNKNTFAQSDFIIINI
jgi:phage baseplate assembly protein W